MVVPDAGVAGEDPPGPSTSLPRAANLPGVVIAVTGVTGGSGPNGNLVAGDRPIVTFTLKQSNGSPWAIGDMTAASILLSGPSSNYQRVIAPQSDLRTAAKRIGPGTYAYTMPAIPATYAPPVNDSTSFDADDGELTGQPLLPGTYTFGIQMYRGYTIDGASVRDADNAVFDVLVGTATAVEARDVVTQANCDGCHKSLRAHGGTRNEVRYCLLCHTAGSEDKNVATAAGGTPGVSVDFGVMVHRIHNAEHLPSVVGVGVNNDGTPDYSRESQPLEYVGFQDAVLDFSHVGFPAMPGAYVAYMLSPDGKTYTGTGGNGPMPRDVGYAALSAPAKHKDDEVRSGITACGACHGDPDGAGPLAAPAQGDHYASTVTRKACGSCHDDIDWTKPYTANGATMGPQPDDRACAVCHPANGGVSPVAPAHLHPYDDASLNKGLRITLGDIGAPNGSFAEGDTIPVAFSITNGAGANVSPNDVTRAQFMVVGPTQNPQVVVPAVLPFDTGMRRSSPFTGNGTASKPRLAADATAQTIAVAFSSATDFTVIGSTTPPAAFTVGAAAGSATDVSYAGATFKVTQGATPFAPGDRFYYEALPAAASYNINLPLDVSFEVVGRATGVADVLTVGNAPLRWGRQTVFERTAVSGTNVLAAASREMDRYVTTDAATAALAVGDRVVIDDGLPTEEYAQVGRIQTFDDFFSLLDLGGNDRIHFTTALRFAHAAGASVRKVTLSARREGTQYTVSDAAAGKITLVAGAFASGAPVVVSYRTDARFGWRRGPGDALQPVFQPAAADSPDIGQEAGDWVGLRLLPGTYTVGAWGHTDYTVTPKRQAAAATRAWDDITTDETTYRTISPPANKNVLFGGATAIQERKIASSEACDGCHGDVQAHGNGRKGLGTCLMCHSTPGMEDGPKFTFATWYVPPTPAVSMDFRQLLHKVHMGKELAQKDTYEMIGVFLGKPYIVTLENKGFTAMPGGTKECASCHIGDSWQAPMDRRHPDQSVPVRTWTDSCGSCHDSEHAIAHMRASVFVGQEACATCHGPGREFNVAVSHKSY